MPKPTADQPDPWRGPNGIGIVGYFSRVEDADLVSVQEALISMADRLESSLKEPAPGSKLGVVVDDLDVASIRSAVRWIDASVRMRGNAFYGLVDVVFGGNAPQVFGGSEADAYARFERRIKDFVEANKER